MMGVLAFALKNWRLVAAVLSIVTLLGGAGAFILKVQHDAYASGYAKARAECEDDKQKQEQANQIAINEAAKKLTDLEQQLELKDGQIDDYISKLDAAADKDAGANNCGIGSDSVQRLNAID